MLLDVLILLELHRLTQLHMQLDVVLYMYIYNHVRQTDLKQRNSVRLAEDRMNRLTYYMLCSDCVKTQDSDLLCC